jgi:hypothetical protein
MTVAALLARFPRHIPLDPTGLLGLVTDRRVGSGCLRGAELGRLLRRAGAQRIRGRGRGEHGLDRVHQRLGAAGGRVQRVAELLADLDQLLVHLAQNLGL